MPSGVMRGRTFLAVAMMLLNVKRSFEILLKLFGTHQSPFNDVLTTTTSSSSCSHVINLQQTLNTLNRVSDIHRFRRSLALEDPVCYNALLDDIVTASVISNNKNPMNNQTKKPIFYLHLPKTGGTSLCKMAIHKGLKTPEGGHNNCNYKTFGPYWGFPGIVKKTGGMQYTSCATLQTTNYEFLANERFLDWHINDDPFCEGFRYLVSIRDILDHRISIRNTLWKDTYAGQAGGRRLVLQTELVSREYYHWALLAGRSTQKERYRPVPSDYDMAKRTLMGFDFLVDFTKPSSECNHLVLKLLDFPQTFWKENVRNSVQKDQMAARHNRTHLLETNPLDLHLYNFSQQLMEIDCEFFTLLLERQKK